MTKLFSAVATFAFFIGACGSESPAPTPEASAKFHFQFMTDPGTETYWCQYAAMPDHGGNPVNVAGFKWATSDAHHWALFRTTGLDASAVDGKPFQCFTSAQTDAAAPASIVSQPTTDQTELIYPDGYAIPFASGEIVMVQFHTVNPSTAPVEPTLDLTAVLADGPVTPIGEFQFYDPFVYVPANGEGHASMRYQMPQDVDMVYMTTHQHERGVGFSVFLDPPNGPESTTPILSAGSWEEPASKLGIMHVPAGASFRVYCDYRDTSGVDTFQGTDKRTAEMCQFYGFYAPPVAGPAAVLFEACVPSMIQGGTGDMYGTGSASCADTLACVSACAPSDAPSFGRGKFPVGACWQQCLVNSCPSASTEFNGVFACVQSKCAVQCAAGASDPGCQACLGANCLPEVTACQSAACSVP